MAETEGHYSNDSSFTGWALAPGTGTPLTFVNEDAHHEFLEVLHVITTAPETAAAALLRVQEENKELTARLALADALADAARAVIGVPQEEGELLDALNAYREADR